jgi:uncharacterized protein YutE (UPF0331/DUF86 family)
VWHAGGTAIGHVIYEYVALDLDRVVEALRTIGPIERFVDSVARLERDAQQ